MNANTKDDLSTKSQNNLMLLAQELAQNYFNTSIPEKEMSTEFLETVKKEVFNSSHIKFVPQAEDYHNTDKPPQSSIANWEDMGGKDNWARNILVLGAGCTYDSFEYIPLANEAIKKIQSRFKYGNKSLEQILDEYKSYDKKDKSASVTNTYFNDNKGITELITKYYEALENLKLHSPFGFRDKETPDFETSLHLLNTFFPVSEIREQIKELYNYRHGPTEFYEIVAHMFKHKLIDVIINFNFDELLDQALDDEFGNSNYYKIISDGDCRPAQELLVDGKLKVPIYIKPHGTASHKSTLRFTKDQYYNLPRDISNLLKEIFSLTDAQAKRVNLITTGFEMGSVEFNQILKDTLGSTSKIFSFTHFLSFDEKINDKTGINDIDERINKINTDYANIFQKKDESPELYIISQQCLANTVEKKAPSLGKAFHQLLTNSSEFYTKGYFPIDINRHSLIISLFSNQKLKNSVINETDYKISPNYENATTSEVDNKYFLNYFRSSDYFKDRTIIEIIISLFQENGSLNIEDALTQRAGEYYKLYNDQYENEKRLEEKKGLKLEKPGYSFSELVKDLVQEKSTLKLYKQLECSVIKGGLNTPEEKLFDLFRDIINNSNGLFSEVFNNSIKNISEDNKILLNKALYGLLHTNNSTLMPNFTDPRYHIFKQFSAKDILHTNLAIDLHFLKSLSANNTKFVLSVADKPKKFEKFAPLIKEKGQEVVLILAAKDDNEASALNNEIKETIKKNTMKNEDIYLFFIPPEKHTHHMTLFLNNEIKTNSDKWLKGASAIYYHQDPYSSKMNPILLNETINIEKLLSQYNYYIDGVSSNNEYRSTYTELYSGDEGLQEAIRKINKIILVNKEH
jgi:hypothetical protein